MPKISDRMKNLADRLNNLGDGKMRADIGASADIVERLRKVANWTESDFDIAGRDMLEEAADEIERLRHPVQAVRGPSEPLQCLRCGTIDAFGPVSKKDTTNG